MLEIETALTLLVLLVAAYVLRGPLVVLLAMLGAAVVIIAVWAVECAENLRNRLTHD